MPKRAFGVLIVLAGMLCFGLVLVTDWPTRRNILMLPEQPTGAASDRRSSTGQAPNAAGAVNEDGGVAKVQRARRSQRNSR
jgi:hypothetical protein